MKDFENYIDFLRAQLSLQAEQQNFTLTWNWICSNLISILQRYPGGTTDAIILTELGNILLKPDTPKAYNSSSKKLTVEDFHSNYTPSSAIFDCSVEKITQLPGTQTYLLTVSDSKNKTIDLYLHQKFYPIINTPLLTPGARLQIIGGRSVNTNNVYKLLPAERCIIKVPNKQLTLKQFKYLSFDEMSAKMKQRNVATDFEGVIHVTIIDITNTEKNNTKIKKIQLAEVTSPRNRIYLMLYDEQTPLASAFKPKDSWLIINPHIPLQKPIFGEHLYIEYGPKTIFNIIVPPPIPKEIPSSTDPLYTQDEVNATQNNLTQDPDGNWDFKAFPNRISIEDLVAPSHNICLFGKISSFSTNSPIDGTSRFAVRVSIGVLSVDVTFFDYSTTHLRIGQYVFLEGIKMTQQNRQNLFQCSNIVAVSTLRGILNSPINKISLIKDISESDNFWVIRACIVDISVGTLVSSSPDDVKKRILTQQVSYFGRILLP